MQTVIFENDAAIFVFSRQEIVDHLKTYSLEHNVKEATDLLEFIGSPPGEAIRIQAKDVFFHFIVLEILDKGHGQAFWKECGENYKAKQLQPRNLGLGPNPLRVKTVQKGFSLRRLFSRIKRTSGIGGKRYLCLKDHELIAVITWIS